MKKYKTLFHSDRTCNNILIRFNGLFSTAYKADNEAPVISGTPSTVNVDTDASSPNATVSWTPPTASDAGGAVTLTSDYSPGDTFPIGTTSITYTATDSSGNMATSTFAVVVTGNYDNQLGNREGRIY